MLLLNNEHKKRVRKNYKKRNEIIMKNTNKKNKINNKTETPVMCELNNV